MWKAAQPSRLGKKERELRKGFARAGSTPQKIVLRIRIVLRSADGAANHRVAREPRTSRPTVWHWRRRFATALYLLHPDTPAAARPRSVAEQADRATWRR